MSQVQLCGNVVSDAALKTLNEGAQVINFTIALNYEYTKPDGQVVKLPSFIDCQYWKKSDIHRDLKKGRKVIVFGRIFPDAYTNARGEAKAVIRLRVDEVFMGEINERGNRETGKQKGRPDEDGEPVGVMAGADDLPF